MARIHGVIRLSEEDMEWFMKNEGKRIEFEGKDFTPFWETDPVHPYHKRFVAYDIHDSRYEFDVV